jgi:hypothetical protein
MPVWDTRILIKDLYLFVGQVRSKAEPWRAGSPIKAAMPTDVEGHENGEIELDMVCAARCRGRQVS